MKFNFSFNAHSHNFWPIYEAIKRFYPIGIKRISNSYFDYPGIKELEAKVASSIHDEEAYKSWKLSLQAINLYLMRLIQW